jgi:dethiobiotin synthetase
LTSHPPPATSHGLFVTGTDTGVGKTLIAAAVLRALASRGVRAVGMKPVAAGCARTAHGLRNEDATILLAASNVEAPIDLINPYRFEPAIAPHIAATQAGVTISLARIGDAFAALSVMADRVVVEGAGGILVPLNDHEDFADLAGLLALPVLLVVGMRLGCLNHALLTAQAVRRRGLRLSGWVANCLEATMPALEDNVQALRCRIEAPLLGTLPFGTRDTALAASFINLDAVESGAMLKY